MHASRLSSSESGPGAANIRRLSQAAGVRHAGADAVQMRALPVGWPAMRAGGILIISFTAEGWVLLSYFRKGPASEGSQTFCYLRPRQRPRRGCCRRAGPEAG